MHGVEIYSLKHMTMHLVIYVAIYIVQAAIIYVCILSTGYDVMHNCYNYNPIVPSSEIPQHNNYNNNYIHLIW